MLAELLGVHSPTRICTDTKPTPCTELELRRQFYHLFALFFWSSSCWFTNLSSLIINVAMVLAPGY